LGEKAIFQGSLYFLFEFHAVRPHERQEPKFDPPPETLIVCHMIAGRIFLLIQGSN